MTMPEPDVFAEASGFIAACALPEHQLELIATALDDLRERLAGERVATAHLDCVRMPRLVFAAVAGEDGFPPAARIALFLLYLGVHLLDDAADGDLSPRWRQRSAAEVTLAAATFISALAPLALARVAAPPNVIATLHHAAARRLLAMSAGQQFDLNTARRAAATAAEIEAAAAAKSGEALALYAEVGARLAMAPAEAVAAYCAMGLALGVARQLRSDCADLFHPRGSRDLRRGTRTLPIVLQIDQLAGAERARFLALLDRACTHDDAHPIIRAELLKRGILQSCALIVETYCARARTALRRAGPLQRAAEALSTEIQTASLFPVGDVAQPWRTGQAELKGEPQWMPSK
jgi:geranylgeranyl pyrophosphate synthase